MAKSNDSNIFGALCYLPIIGIVVSIVFFVIKNENKFVRYHALQGILLAIGLWLIGVVLAITIIGIILMPILWLLSILAWLFSMYKAYNGEMHELPIVGKIVKTM